MLIDTHCHIQFNAYKEEQEKVIKKTLEQNIGMIVVGTQKDTSRLANEVAEKYENVWSAVGLHPNHLCEQEFVDDDELPLAIIKTRCEKFDYQTYLKLAQHSKCRAIGEVGLDYYRIPENLDLDEVKAEQNKVCRSFFDLATETNLPLIIHSREAFVDQIALIKEYIDQGKIKRRGVIHCFTGTLKEAQAYIDLGFLISFTGIATFKPRKEMGEFSPLQEVIKALPLTSIMVETDSPYLAPVPYRGKRAEPWMVIEVAKKIAELKKISLEEVIKVTGKNAQKFFVL